MTNNYSLVKFWSRSRFVSRYRAPSIPIYLKSIFIFFKIGKILFTPCHNYSLFGLLKWMCSKPIFERIQFETADPPSLERVSARPYFSLLSRSLFVRSFVYSFVRLFLRSFVWLGTKKKFVSKKSSSSVSQLALCLPFVRARETTSYYNFLLEKLFDNKNHFYRSSSCFCLQVLKAIFQAVIMMKTVNSC
jgi:hypothetical protein